MTAPLRCPWWRCQRWRPWHPSWPWRISTCRRWRWHRGFHSEQIWEVADGGGWIQPFAVTGSNAGKVFR